MVSYDNANRFGEQVKQLRRERGLTQEQLGAHAHCSTSLIRKLEQGQRAATLEVAGNLGQCFGLTDGTLEAFLSLAGFEPPATSITHDPSAKQAFVGHVPHLLNNTLGREADVEHLRTRVLDPITRLITLTGVGGVGKTRLALVVAHATQAHFADGVVFIDLSDATTPEQVFTAIVRTLRLQPANGDGSHTSAHLAKQALHNKHVLLLLDNFEQVVSGTTVVADLLAACTRITILVTSREPLHLYGEGVTIVEPLPTPHARADSPAEPVAAVAVEALAANPSVALFVSRAKSVNPRFALGPHNCNAVAELCRHLDGLPLAIELVASRTKLLSPQQILARWDAPSTYTTTVDGTAGQHHPSVGMSSTLPARHRTLHRTILWSYRHLSLEQQQAFLCVSVCANSCDVTTLCEVLWRFRRHQVGVAGQSSDVLVMTDTERMALWDLLTGLIDKNLLQQREVAGTSRLMMLETLRAFARTELSTVGLAVPARHCHMEAFAHAARQLAPAPYGTRDTQWQTASTLDYDNLQLALDFAIAQHQVHPAYLLCITLARLWANVGQFETAQRRFAEVLALPISEDRTMIWLRQTALRVGGGFAVLSNNLSLARSYREEALHLVRSLNDELELMFALDDLASTLRLIGDNERVLLLYRESSSLWKVLADDTLPRPTLQHWAGLNMSHEDYLLARDVSERQVAYWRQINLPLETAVSLIFLGEVERCQHNDEAASRCYTEAYAKFQVINDHRHAGWSLHNLAYIALRQAHTQKATELFHRSIEHFLKVNYMNGVASAIAGLACALPDVRTAAVLMGAVDAFYATAGRMLDPVDAADCEPHVARIAHLLSPDEHAHLRAQGRDLTLHKAIAMAMAFDVLDTPPASANHVLVPV